MRVRDYSPGDLAACLAVFESNVPEFFHPAEREGFAAFLAALPGPYVVVEDETGALVACGGYAVAPGTATADLCWGMVSRPYHHSGLGRLLLDARLGRIAAHPGLRDVALRTSQLTRGFYERRGFVTEQVLPNGIAPGLDRCDMRLRLPLRNPLIPSGAIPA
ncbi:MAG: GNAT family N-acetyltransferase [Verrucomicrobia bacterium]|nr:GNAT family N-acetyltransferase [Verrucomicrobiota bacterium]